MLTYTRRFENLNPQGSLTPQTLKTQSLASPISPRPLTQHSLGVVAEVLRPHKGGGVVGAAAKRAEVRDAAIPRGRVLAGREPCRHAAVARSHTLGSIAVGLGANSNNHNMTSP